MSNPTPPQPGEPAGIDALRAKMHELAEKWRAEAEEVRNGPTVQETQEATRVAPLTAGADGQNLPRRSQRGEVTAATVAAEFQTSADESRATAAMIQRRIDVGYAFDGDDRTRDHYNHNAEYYQNRADAVRAALGGTPRPPQEADYWKQIGDLFQTGGMYDPAFLFGMIQSQHALLAAAPPTTADPQRLLAAALEVQKTVDRTGEQSEWLAPLGRLLTITRELTGQPPFGKVPTTADPSPDNPPTNARCCDGGFATVEYEREDDGRKIASVKVSAYGATDAEALASARHIAGDLWVAEPVVQHIQHVMSPGKLSGEPTSTDNPPLEPEAGRQLGPIGHQLMNPEPCGPFGSYYWVCACSPRWAIRNGTICSGCGAASCSPTADGPKQK